MVDPGIFRINVYTTCATCQSVVRCYAGIPQVREGLAPHSPRFCNLGKWAFVYLQHFSANELNFHFPVGIHDLLKLHENQLYKLVADTRFIAVLSVFGGGGGEQDQIPLKVTLFLHQGLWL